MALPLGRAQEMADHTLSLISQSAFVGRKREITRLCVSLEEARSGMGRFLLVRDASGIGKTRLAAEITFRFAKTS